MTPRGSAASPTSIVLPAELKSRLEDAANRSGRKTAAEMRARLEASLAFDERVFGETREKAKNRALANSVMALAEILEVSDGHWSESKHARNLLALALKTLVETGVVISNEEKPKTPETADLPDRDKAEMMGRIAAAQLRKHLTPYKFPANKSNQQEKEK